MEDPADLIELWQDHNADAEQAPSTEDAGIDDQDGRQQMPTGSRFGTRVGARAGAIYSAYLSHTCMCRCAQAQQRDCTLHMRHDSASVSQIRSDSASKPDQYRRVARLVQACLGLPCHTELRGACTASCEAPKLVHWPVFGEVVVHTFKIPSGPAGVGDCYGAQLSGQMRLTASVLSVSCLAPTA